MLARADELINEAAGAPLLASQVENEWPREDHTNPFAQPERTGIVRVHQKSQDQPGAKVEPDCRTTAPDSRAHAVRRRHRPRRPALAKIRPDEIFRERQLAIYRDARLRPLAPKIFGLWAASSSLTRRRSATSRRNREISSWSSAIRSSLRLGSSSLRHRCKVMTLTPSMRAISLCSFPRLAKSFACASFVATSTRECRFTLAMPACPQPPRAWLFRHFPDRVHFLDNRKRRYPFPEKASFYGRVVRSVVGVRGVRMNIDDSRLIVGFQRLMHEMMVRKLLGFRIKSPERVYMEQRSH